MMSAFGIEHTFSKAYNAGTYRQALKMIKPGGNPVVNRRATAILQNGYNGKAGVGYSGVKSAPFVRGQRARHQVGPAAAGWRKKQSRKLATSVMREKKGLPSSPPKRLDVLLSEPKPSFKGRELRLP